MIPSSAFVCQPAGVLAIVAGFLDHPGEIITLLDINQRHVKGRTMHPMVNVTQVSAIQKLTDIRKAFSTAGVP